MVVTLLTADKGISVDLGGVLPVFITIHLVTSGAIAVSDRPKVRG